jgi:hypothetical protein
LYLPFSFFAQFFSSHGKKNAKGCIKDLIFLSNYIKMEYGEKRKSVFFTPKNSEDRWARGFLRFNTV